MRILAVLTGLTAGSLLSFSTADASNCAVRQRVQIVQHQAVVVQPAVIATFAAVPVAVQVPAYSVGFAPEGSEIGELRKAIRDLQKTIETLKAPPADDLQTKVTRVLSTHCASCHTGAQAKGKLIMFPEPGKLSPTLDRFLVWHEASDGRMPPAPNKPIPDDDERLLKEWVREAAAARKAARK